MDWSDGVWHNRLRFLYWKDHEFWIVEETRGAGAMEQTNFLTWESARLGLIEHRGWKTCVNALELPRLPTLMKLNVFIIYRLPIDRFSRVLFYISLYYGCGTLKFNPSW